MAGKSDYLENKYLDWLLRAQAFTAPTITYVGLLTTAPTDAGGGTEVTGGSYARVTVSSSLTNWAGTNATGATGISSGTSGVTSNNVPIQFPAPTANWGVVTSFGVYDAISGGNLLYFGNLGVSKTINNGDAAPFFQSGSLTITED